MFDEGSTVYKPKPGEATHDNDGRVFERIACRRLELYFWFFGHLEQIPQRSRCCIDRWFNWTCA